MTGLATQPATGPVPGTPGAGPSAPAAAVTVSASALEALRRSIGSLNVASLQALGVALQQVGGHPAWLNWVQHSGADAALRPFMHTRLALCLCNPDEKLQLASVKLPRRMPLPDLARLVPDLRHVDLGNTGLQEFPPVLLGLRQLTTLSLTRNAIRDYPPELAGMASLVHLDLSHGPLEELPAALLGLRGLQRLNLNSNEALRLPPDLGALVESLTHLDLSHTGQQEFPRVLLSLAHLKELDLTANEIAELPQDIDKLESLERLVLVSTALDGRLPDSLRNCSRLEVLDLDTCLLRQLPDWIGDLASLRRIVLAGNEQLDNLPESMARLHPECLIQMDRQEPLLPADLSWHQGQVDPSVFEEPVGTDNDLIDDPLPLHEAVAAWQAAKQPAGAGLQAGPAGPWEAWAAQDGAAAFAEWLQRMQRTYTFRTLRDGPAGPEGTEILRVPPEVAADMAQVLPRMAALEPFRDECFGLALETLGHCADRRLLGFGDMQAALLKSRALAGETPATELLAASEALFNRKALTEVAREHAARHRVEQEEVEVVLALETGLRGQLALPPGVAKMINRSFARQAGKVDAQALDTALAAVQRLRADEGPEGWDAFLAGQWPPSSPFKAWRQYLQGRHPQRFESLERVNEQAQDEMARDVAVLVDKGAPEPSAWEQAGMMAKEKWAAAERQLVRELTQQEQHAMGQGALRGTPGASSSSAPDFAAAATAARGRDRARREQEPHGRATSPGGSPDRRPHPRLPDSPPA
jgi:Leucine-rich repeat (LRR) protein